MDDWKNIMTFTYPHEAYIVKGRLESDGIPVQIRDELTTQVNNFYSNAIGGVKLLIPQEDYKRAMEILIKTGQIKEPEKSENKILKRLDKISSKLPWIGKSVLELRLLIIAALLLIVIMVPVAIMLYYQIGNN